MMTTTTTTTTVMRMRVFERANSVREVHGL